MIMFIPDLALGIGIILGLIGIYVAANLPDTKSYPGREYIIVGLAIFACVCTAGLTILTLTTMMAN
jgi:hypothetical protein